MRRALFSLFGLLASSAIGITCAAYRVSFEHLLIILTIAGISYLVLLYVLERKKLL